MTGRPPGPRTFPTNKPTREQSEQKDRRLLKTSNISVSTKWSNYQPNISPDNVLVSYLDLTSTLQRFRKCAFDFISLWFRSATTYLFTAAVGSGAINHPPCVCVCVCLALFTLFWLPRLGIQALQKPVSWGGHLCCGLTVQLQAGSYIDCSEWKQRVDFMVIKVSKAASFWKAVSRAVMSSACTHSWPFISTKFMFYDS